MAVDLVFVAMGGVQRFLAESRKTVDAAGASLAVCQVVGAAGRHIDGLLGERGGPHGLVFPTAAALAVDAERPAGVTNRIVFVAEAGTGPDIAREAVDAARAAWDALVKDAYGGPRDTPGMPELSWVCVTGDDQRYGELWERAQSALSSRRRSRVFEVLAKEKRENKLLCAQSPALPAGPVPPRTPKVEAKEHFSVAGWTKRAFGRRRQVRFPSTTVIASAPFRARLIARAATEKALRDELAGNVTVLDAVTRRLRGHDVHHRPLSGVDVSDGLLALSSRLGTEISPDAWEEDALRAEHGEHVDADLARRGAHAARAISQTAERYAIPPLTPYYAVVVQDLDHLGERIGSLGLHEQRAASELLTDLGAAQLALSEGAEYLGVPIYAGGDDFLGFVPAAHALPLAGALRTLTRTTLADGPLAEVTASTSVVFAHMTSPLRQVIATAQDALHTAKDAVGRHGRARDALTVVVLRRGGERARTIQPWWPERDGADTAAALLAKVAPDSAPSALSARLAASLERDRAELDSLAGADAGLLRLELRRLVKRQHGPASVADALVLLGETERLREDDMSFQPLPAALVARFLDQECR